MADSIPGTPGTPRRARGLRAIASVLLLPLALILTPGAQAQPRGYQPRDCGFDMNRDGIVGGSGDCDVCDGSANDGDGDGSAADVIYVSCGGDPGGSYTFYTAGTDTPGCGSPTAPCLTIGYAFATIADGPSDGAEDIVCFRNLCTEENLSPRSDGGGVAGTYTRTASGSDARSWELPSDPVMLVGWDVDDDGVYPPEDEDHAAILAPPATCPGTPNQGCMEAQVKNPEDDRHRFYQKDYERAIYLLNNLDNVELAHFAVRDYGRYTLTDDSGFFGLHFHPPGSPSYTDPSDHIYVHDIVATGLNRDSNYNSTTSAINFFNWKATWVAFENLDFEDNGHWFARGGGGNGPADYGPFRFKNLTVTLDACKPPAAVTCDWVTDDDCPQGDVCLADTGCEPAATESCYTRASTAWKIWGYYSGFEVLDSKIDANLRSHANLVLDGRARGIDMAQCTQDWTVRNNELVDFNSALEAGPVSAGYCEGSKLADGVTISNLYARPLTDVVIDRNVIHSPSQLGARFGGIYLLPGGSDYPGQTIGDVTIANNMISSQDGLESCIRVEAGHDWDGSDTAYPVTAPPGSVRLINNSCYGPITGPAAIAIGNPWGLNPAELQQNVVLRNNLVGGKSATAANVATTYAPSGLDAGGNVWDPDGGFRFNDPDTGHRINLAAWVTAAGDTGARECVPSLFTTSGVYGNGDAAAVNGNLHLNPADTCAQGNGSDLSSLAPTDLSGQDLDGEARPQSGSWDSGADEVVPRPLTEPPLRFAGAPTGYLPFGTTSTTLEVRTDQVADCAWSTAPNVPFASQTPFGTTGGNLHSTALSGLPSGVPSTYYVRCENTSAVANTDDYAITFTAIDLDTQLVAHWALDDATGCTASDTAGSAYHGTLSPTCSSDSPSWISGIADGALHFDGSNDYLSVAHNAALAFTGSFTASAWIRPTSFGDSDYGRIIAKQKYVGGFGAGWSFYVGNQPSGSPAGRRTLCANIGTTELGCGSDDAVELNVWQHVMLVYDDPADTATFYVDGTAAGSFVADGTLTASTVPLLIGDRDGLTRSFAGDIDDVRLWNRALTAVEAELLSILPDQPAIRSGGAPAGNLAAGTGSVTLEAHTNKPAACRWSDTPGTAYAAMTQTLTADTAGTLHQAALTVADDTFYRAYVRCEDGFGNVNADDYEIAFYVGFHPSDLSGVLFFVESRHGITLATGTTLADYVNYCEPNLFTNQVACVRRWEDQSGYTGDPGIVGREFGQDDAEKPVLIADCINGLPCVQGGPTSLSSNFVQDLSFEIELPHQAEALGALSVYLLARPVTQSADFAYFGFAGTTLWHHVADDSLKLQINNSANTTVTSTGAVDPDAWHLIEIHRDAANAITVLVDGTNVTTGTPVLSGGFDFRFLFSVSRVNAMYGQIAAFLLVDGALTSTEQAQVRTYLDAVYDVLP